MAAAVADRSRAPILFASGIGLRRGECPHLGIARLDRTLGWDDRIWEGAGSRTAVFAQKPASAVQDRRVAAIANRRLHSKDSSDLDHMTETVSLDELLSTLPSGHFQGAPTEAFGAPAAPVRFVPPTLQRVATPPLPT